jgi:hypothetical protein
MIQKGTEPDGVGLVPASLFAREAASFTNSHAASSTILQVVGLVHINPSFFAKLSASPSQSCVCLGGGDHPEAQPNHCTAKCKRQ